MIDFANGIISINKDRRKVISNENLINPAMARPFFGNPEKADIVILKSILKKILIVIILIFLMIQL